MQTQVKFHHKFNQNFRQYFHMSFKICIRHLVLLEMIYLEKVAQKFQMQSK